MRRYQVSVNGKQFVVQIEEMGEGPSERNGAKTASAASEAKPAPAVTDRSAPPPAAAATPAGPSELPETAEGHVIKAPLRGQILRLAVKPGDEVKRGQVLLTIEALKLENEIVSPVTGVVTGVFTQPGAMVEAGTVLVTVTDKEL